MADIAKLRKRAAEFEQKKQFDKALAEYVKILAEMDSRVDEADVALYNRVGDLMLRQGNSAQAVHYYEKAVDLYTEGGFFNNAIALCNKILRNSPNHSAVYYKLGKISAKKGFINDAKQHFLEYADRMQRDNRLEEAFRALKEFADLCPDQDDIRLMLADQLVKKSRNAEAIEQLQTLFDKYESEGRSNEARATADRIRAIDPNVEPKSRLQAPTQRPGDLIFLEVNYDSAKGPTRSRPGTPAPSAGAPSTTRGAGDDASRTVTGLSHGSGIDQTGSGPAPGAPSGQVAGLERTTLFNGSLQGRDAGTAAPGGSPSRPSPATPAMYPPVRDRLGFLRKRDDPPTEQASGGRGELKFIFPDEPLAEPSVEETATATPSPATLETELPSISMDDDLLEPEPIAAAPVVESFDDALLDEPTILLPDSEWDELDAPIISSEPETPRATPPAFVTQTLADLYLEQGFADDAITMYRQLLEQRPDDEELRQRVAALEASLGDAASDLDEPTLLDLPRDASTTLSPGQPGMEIQLEQSAFLHSAELEDAPVPGRPSDAGASATATPTYPAEAELVERSSELEALEVTPLELAPALQYVDDSADDELSSADALSISDDLFSPMDALASELEAEGALSQLGTDRELGAQAPDVAVSPAESEAMQPASARVELLRRNLERDPANWVLYHDLGLALSDQGDRLGALQALETALAGFERTGDRDAQRDVVDAILRIDADSVTHHQKRVEYAVREGDRTGLVESYADLADCLLRTGFADKARVLYGRVLDLSPEHARARAMLGSLPETKRFAALNGEARTTGSTRVVPEPPPTPVRAPTPPAAAAASSQPAERRPAAPPSDEGFINLADWLRDDDDEPRSTRMVVDGPPIPPDGQVEFREMLSMFKEGVAANLDDTDHESHYDLGVAYKEMGLLDEAVAEFQKALRGTEQRVRTYEALGQCFMEKGQPQIAVTVLSRASRDKNYTEEMLVGVLYLLGQASERLAREDDAKEYFQRVIAVDINFKDARDRLAALERQTG